MAVGWPLTYLPEIPAAVAPAAVCKNCKCPYVEDEYELPLCWDCRRWASLRPLPQEIKLICVLVLMALLYAGYYYPDTLGASIAYQEGQRAERAKDFTRAVKEYQTVTAIYPESPVAVARLGLAYYHGGHVLEAVWVLGYVWRSGTPKEVAMQVNAVFREVKKRARVK
ncbi:MAG: hypothetical protein ABSF45_20195 [Terriglobia bacterium]